AVLYVGRIAPEKNLRLAVAAYRAMRRHSDSLKFVTVGDGPLRATLQREHPDILFHGVLTGERLATHYASADVFLFPSETETFGNVTLEAMASGLAVIAYNYAAARTHIEQGRTGILVPYGDAENFITSAVRLVREPQLLDNVRRRAREIAGVLVNPVQSFHPNTPPPSDTILLTSEMRKTQESASEYAQWLHKLREVCSAHDIPLIFDEVYTGFRLAPG